MPRNGAGLPGLFLNLTAKDKGRALCRIYAHDRPGQGMSAHGKKRKNGPAGTAAQTVKYCSGQASTGGFFLCPFDSVRRRKQNLSAPVLQFVHAHITIITPVRKRGVKACEGLFGIGDFGQHLGGCAGVVRHGQMAANAVCQRARMGGRGGGHGVCRVVVGQRLCIFAAPAY